VAAELKKELGVEARLLVGSPGEFTVWVDENVVAGKRQGIFPTPAEAVAAVRSALGGETERAS
jgi:hypothetical protein